MTTDAHPVHVASTAPPPGLLERLKGRIAAVTGVLVVVPALLNAGVDVWRVAANVPRTDAERINAALFEHYFNQQPLQRFPVEVKDSSGTIVAEFSVWNEGDIYVRFGKHSQWFPFPARNGLPERKRLSLMPEALAGGPTGPSPSPEPTSRTQRYDGRQIVETLRYGDQVEVLRIDPNSGRIVDWKRKELPPAASGASPDTAMKAEPDAADGRSPPPARYTIDLDTLRRARSQ